MSVEFRSVEERTTAGGVRELLRAVVDAAALVSSPEYDTTTAEVRKRARPGGCGFDYPEPYPACR